jgi:hypothetical protein
MISKDDNYFDLKKLAEYSSLSVRTLRDYISDSSDPIPSYCLRRKILVKKSEFDNWISNHRYNNKTDAMLDEIMSDLKC